MSKSKQDILQSLQADIMRLQGFRQAGTSSLDIALGPISAAFPGSSFPLGAVHEFLCEKKEDAAATSGFIAALLSSIMGNTGAAIWISSSGMIFPPALKHFGVEPDRIIFIDLRNEKEVFRATEEALKCHALSAVIVEMQGIDFTASRRLQLAVEQSLVTGFIIRSLHRKLNATACASRWRIISSASGPDVRESHNEFPGVGFAKWKVELLKVRNGKPGSWTIQWVGGKFETGYERQVLPPLEKKKTG